MMFATLDDLEGQVEMLVFNSAYAANADKVDVDRIVLVRGRVDHKEAGETKLVAQEVEPFEPTAGGGAARRRAGGGRAGRPPADAARLAGRCRTASWRSSRRSSATTPATTSCCSRWASAGCCWARTSGCPRTAPAGPSWRGSPARPPRWSPDRPLYTGRVQPLPAQTAHRAARVPSVLLVLRPRRPPVGLHRVGLPVPLPVRRRGHRPPLHGLHEQGLPRRDRRGAVRAGRAHPPGLRRREDDAACRCRSAARPWSAPTTATREAFDCVNPDFFKKPCSRTSTRRSICATSSRSPRRRSPPASARSTRSR